MRYRKNKSQLKSEVKMRSLREKKITKKKLTRKSGAVLRQYTKTPATKLRCNIFEEGEG